MGLLLTILIVGLGICIFAYCYEKKYWNNGFCRECNTKWKHAITDSQGGNLYYCQCSEKHSTWVSWGMDH